MDHRTKPRLSTSKTPLASLAKEARGLAGLTQIQMAQLVGVSLKALREIEQGREDGVTIGTAKKIAAYFGKTITLADIIAVDDSTQYVIGKDELLAKLRSLKTVFQETFGIEKLALFGSYARSEANQDSDIDILIKSAQKYSIKEISKMEIIASQVLGGKKVDLVLQSEIHPDVEKTAMKDLLYV